jgi:polysaccharide biosynthesis protein PslH
MKILLLCPWFPYPPNWGFAKRVFHILEVLARRHELTLLTYTDGDDAEQVRVLEGLASVHTVPRPALPLGKRLAQLASVASPTSFQQRLMYAPAMQEALDRLSAATRFDVIHVSTSQMACFRFDRRPPLVLDEHNVEYELYYRVFQAEGSLPRRAFNWLEYRKFRREEIAAWRSVSGCAMTSAREAALVRSIVPDTPTTVVPNAVDTEFFAPSDTETDPDMIVLTGLMKYRPNVDGAIFFVRDILPRILRARPKAVFYIVGAGAPPEVVRLASPNVVVTGGVDDVRPYVHRAAVFAVPLRMGSGTRLKVLEGLSMGKPMVSTSIGCEGIDVTHREHLLIADDADAFADAALELMRNHELSRTLAGNGRALMLARYRWESIVEELEAFYERLIIAAGGGAARG